MTEQDKRQIRKSLERDKGVVFDDDEGYYQELAGFLDDLPETFPDLDVYGLALLYVYDRGKQGEAESGSGGVTWKHKSTDKREACSIGIATEAIDRGKEYALSVFVHEAAHVLTGVEGHTELFGIVLDGLLFRCAEAGLDLVKLPYPEEAPERPQEAPTPPG